MNCSICLDPLDSLCENNVDVDADVDIDKDIYKDIYINDKTPLLFRNKNKKYSKNKKKPVNKVTNVEGSIKTLVCGHKFHKECIDEWLDKQNNCPYCRRILKNFFDVKIYWNNRTISFSKYTASITFPIDYPDKRTFDVVIEFKHKSKQNIILNKFSVQEFSVYKGKIILKYFKRYPDIIDILYIDFKNNEEIQFSDIMKTNFRNQITLANITDDIITDDELVQNSLI